MTKTENGALASQAVRYTRQLLGDVHAMLSMLDAQLLASGWKSITGRVDGSTVRHRFKQPEYWLAASLWRGYFPSDSDSFDRYIAIEVHLDPSTFDEPVIVLSAVSLSKALNTRQAWDGTTREWIVDLVEGATTLPMEFVWEGSDARRVHEEAVRLKAEIIRLFDIPNESALSKEVTARLLNLAST